MIETLEIGICSFRKQYQVRQSNEKSRLIMALYFGTYLHRSFRLFPHHVTLNESPMTPEDQQS